MYMKLHGVWHSACKASNSQQTHQLLQDMNVAICPHVRFGRGSVSSSPCTHIYLETLSTALRLYSVVHTTPWPGLCLKLKMVGHAFVL
jgi:hypothetical protein